MSDNIFSTLEDAVQYGQKSVENWGNLVYRIEEKNGLFYVWFNVWN